jgi:amidohydrolase
MKKSGNTDAQALHMRDREGTAESVLVVSHPRLTPPIVEMMVDTRRDIHAHPELSHHEYGTADRVRRRLVALGINDIGSVDGTAGLVATVNGVRPGRTIALRAELDALPIEEETGLPFKSTRPGVMHACGHDAHTAIALGVAAMLQGIRNQISGRVRFLFQPAEEKEPLGARALVRAGCLDGVDAILGLHVEPDLDAGQVGGLAAGPRTAASDEFKVTIRGVSAHGARPHQGVDAIVAAAALIQDMQTIASRVVDPQEPVVVTVGTIHGGSTAPNIISDRVELTGTIRTRDEQVRRTVRDCVGSMARGIAEVHGATAEVEITPGEPVLANDASLTELVRAAAEGVVGTGNTVERPPPSMGADDFAFYLEHVPGVMIRLGTRNASKTLVYPLHNPRFDLDEDTLAIGATVLFETVCRYLSKGRDGAND